MTIWAARQMFLETRSARSRWEVRGSRRWDGTSNTVDGAAQELRCLAHVFEGRIVTVA